MPAPNILREFEDDEADTPDLIVVVLGFGGMKDAEKNLAGGDPYSCKKCGAILNKFSVIKSAVEAKDAKV